MKRRKFIHGMLFSATAIAVTPQLVLADSNKKKFKRLIILHTNDMHSHIEPFADNDPKFPGKGGMAKRAALIEEIRKEEADVLLFDCGDIFQGTPYFNYFLGEPEIKLMNQMKYDAATIGNHDFDGGLNNLSEKMDLAEFSFINCNYDVKGTVLENKVVPYKIYEKAGLKVGVVGVGIKLEGLVDKKLFGDITYQDPIESVNKTVKVLKEKRCDLIVCLSHLGYDYKNDTVSDIRLASETADIDIILGGHTHTFLKEATKVDNKSGKKTIVSQAGWAGLILGRIDVQVNSETLEVSAFSGMREIS